MKGIHVSMVVLTLNFPHFSDVGQECQIIHIEKEWFNLLEEVSLAPNTWIATSLREKWFRKAE